MLPRLRILQVGDVHLARTAMIARQIDDKDPRFPSAIRNLLAGPPIKAVFRKLHDLIEKGHIDALLFMGDYAEKGNLGGFDDCLRYIAEALQIGEGRNLSRLKTGFVAGNHDINRDLAARPGLRHKFLPLQQTLSNLRLPNMPVEHPVWIKVEDNQHSRIDIALLNSCWGCGAMEFIPEEFRLGISAAINLAISKGDADPAVTSYYDRQLDTPAFCSQTVQSLIDEIANIPRTSLVLTCAHHNLLPQHIPRLAPYTELVNSGALRHALLSMNRPVLYLHGHTHEELVETIQTPSGGILACISAPEASEGFNLLEVVFTQSGLPLTCYVRPWRFDGGIFRERTRQVIPVSGNRRKPGNSTLTEIYKKIVMERNCYWGSLVDTLRDVNVPTPEDKTEESLETLVADQLIDIENYDLDREHWIMRSKI